METLQIAALQVQQLKSEPMQIHSPTQQVMVGHYSEVQHQHIQWFICTTHQVLIQVQVHQAFQLIHPLCLVVVGLILQVAQL